MHYRAARLRTPTGSSTNLQSLTAQAKLAGFDYVKFSAPDQIEVCVKLQDGLEAQIVHFPLTTLLAVPLPPEDEDEFTYPAEHIHEPRKPLLFDKTTSSNEISEHFKLHMFLSPGVRFLRLDPILINLLELAYDDFTDRFYITPGSAYRPHSVNLNNIQTRPDKEKYRFEMGQAVELKPNRRVNDESLFHLGIALMKAGRTVRTQRIGIGIGTKEDRLYFHIRPLTVETEEEAIDVWNSGNAVLYRKLHSIQDEVSKGLPIALIIFPIFTLL